MKRIIHKTIFNEQWLTTDVDERRYLCNQAVDVTDNKCSYFWKNVTCKNCLKQKPDSPKLKPKDKPSEA